MVKESYTIMQTCWDSTVPFSGQSMDCAVLCLMDMKSKNETNFISLLTTHEVSRGDADALIVCA